MRSAFVSVCGPPPSPWTLCGPPLCIGSGVGAGVWAGVGAGCWVGGGGAGGEVWGAVGAGARRLTAPVFQINIGVVEAHDICENYHARSYTLSLFHEATLCIFPVVMSLWKE